MKTVHPLLPKGVTLLACLALIGPVAAQAQHDVASAPSLTAEQINLLDVRVSELIGKKVKSPQGKDWGEIEDLILDVANAHVRYAVVAHGGALGFGTQLAAFPSVLLRPGQDKNELVLHVSEQQFEQAPGFKTDASPNWLDERYSQEVDRLFLKNDEAVRRPSGSRLVRASEIVGRDVSDGGNRAAGEIEDVVVNLGNGHVRYVVLDYRERLGLEGRLIPLPMSAFRVPTRPDINLFLLLDRDRVAQARSFDKESWPDLADVRQRQEIESWISRFPQEDGAQTSGGQNREGAAQGER